MTIYSKMLDRAYKKDLEKPHISIVGGIWVVISGRSDLPVFKALEFIDEKNVKEKRYNHY